MTQKSANAPELLRDMPMQTLMKLFVKLLFAPYRKIIIVIKLIY